MHLGKRPRIEGDSENKGFVGKPRIHLHPRSVEEVQRMAMLNESNPLAMKARGAKFRTNHVGTKLNEAELHEFEALAEKRKQTPSELIRGLVLGEIERDKRASMELEEIASLRLLLLNILSVLARGERMTKETYELIEAEVKKRTASRTLELFEDWQKRGREP